MDPSELKFSEVQGHFVDISSYPPNTWVRITIPILRMLKLSPREITMVGQGHTVNSVEQRTRVQVFLIPKCQDTHPAKPNLLTNENCLG
jgi:hypothetical protein